MYLYKQTFYKMLKFLDHNIFVCGVLSCTTLRYDDILNVAWKSARLKTFCVWGFFVTLTFFNVEIFPYWRTRCSVTGRFVMMTLCFSGCFMKECFFMWALCHKTLFNKCCVQVQYDKIIITLKIKELVHCVIVSKT